MKAVFVGGSRRISRLNDDVRKRIDRIVEQELPILVGDASGIDKAVQRYLHSKTYRRVEVYCAELQCRNNIGAWPVRNIPVTGKRRDRRFYSTKDRAMADESSFGLMIWDGESLGTLMNVFRMCARSKPTVVYVSCDNSFIEVRDREDFDQLLRTSDPSLRDRLERTIAEESALPEAQQLFPSLRPGVGHSS
jgi:adenine-specific DNA-methyltransferase